MKCVDKSQQPCQFGIVPFLLVMVSVGLPGDIRADPTNLHQTVLMPNGKENGRKDETKFEKLETSYDKGPKNNRWNGHGSNGVKDRLKI